MTDSKTFPANYIVSSEDGSSDWASGGLIISAPTLAKFWQSIMQGTHPNPRISSAVRDMLLDSVKGEHYINWTALATNAATESQMTSTGAGRTALGSTSG